MTEIILVWLGIGAVVIAVWLVKAVTESLTKPRPSRPRTPIRRPDPGPAAAEALARKQAEAEAQRRREEARAQCAFLYAIHAPELSGRFAQEHFDRYVRDFLGDQHAPELVEERAARLQDVIRAHVEKVEPAAGPTDLDTLCRDYREQRQRISDSDLDDELKDTLLAQLRIRLTGKLNPEDH